MYDMSVIQMQLKKAAAKNTSQNASENQEENRDIKAMQVEEIKDADLNMNSSIESKAACGTGGSEMNDKRFLGSASMLNKIEPLPKSGFKRVAPGRQVRIKPFPHYFSAYLSLAPPCFPFSSFIHTPLFPTFHVLTLENLS